MKTIQITIGADGQVDWTAAGFKGKECERAAKFLEALGEKTADRKLPEYYQPEQVAVKGGQ